MRLHLHFYRTSSFVPASPHFCILTMLMSSRLQVDQRTSVTPSAQSTIRFAAASAGLYRLTGWATLFHWRPWIGPSCSLHILSI